METQHIYRTYKKADNRCDSLQALCAKSFLVGLCALALIVLFHFISVKNATLNSVLAVLVLLAFSFCLASWVMSFLLDRQIYKLMLVIKES